jgi:hypothetical protein
MQEVLFRGPISENDLLREVPCGVVAKETSKKGQGNSDKGRDRQVGTGTIKGSREENRKVM